MEQALDGGQSRAPFVRKRLESFKRLRKKLIESLGKRSPRKRSISGDLTRCPLITLLHYAFSPLPLISTVPLSTTLRSSLPRTHSSFFAWIRVSNPFGRTKRTLAKTLSYIERTRYFVHFAKEKKKNILSGATLPIILSPLEWIFTLKHSRAIRKQKKKKKERKKEKTKGKKKLETTKVEIIEPHEVPT